MTVSQEFTATAAEREQRSVLELFDAIKKDDTAQIKALVALGVPLDVENINGVVPLTFAANIGALASVKTLLEIGAKPDATDSWGRPAAHFAAKREYAEIVKLLPLLPPDLVPLISKPARQPRTSPAFEPESKLLWNAAKRGSSPRPRSS